MTAVRDRTFEFTSTVTFHDVAAQDIEAYARDLASAVRSVLQGYPSVEAFLVQPDPQTGDLTYGLRVAGVEPGAIDALADEVLTKAITLVAERAGAKSADAEREESVLVLTR